MQGWKQLQTTKDAYTTERELAHNINTSLYEDQMTYIEKTADKEDTDRSKVIRRLIDQGMNPTHEKTAMAVLEDIHAAATDQQTLEAVNLLQHKITEGEVVL